MYRDAQDPDTKYTDIELLKMLARPDPRENEQLWGVDGSSRQNDFLSRVDVEHFAVAVEFDAVGTLGHFVDQNLSFNHQYINTVYQV